MDEIRLKIRQLIDTYDAVNIQLALTIAEGIGKYHWIEEDYLEIVDWIQPLIYPTPKQMLSRSQTTNHVKIIQSLQNVYYEVFVFRQEVLPPPKRFFELIKPKTVEFLNVKENAIPNYIFEWTSITNLFLHSCDFKVLPPAIGQLYQLQHLVLINNHFQKLPSELGRLKDLKTLNCQNNHLLSLPNTLAELPELHTIDCDNNPFYDVPEVLYHIPKLNQIWIAGTNIIESELEILKVKLSSGKDVSWHHEEEDKLPF